MKFIIHNNSDVSDGVIFELIASIIKDGKVSQTNKVKHYCHLTSFKFFNINICCIGRKNNSFTFKVFKK